MKLIDKFLKKLNTNRNTFVTYIFTLITAYLVIDRIIELLFMIFTGVGYSYWGPIEYTLALACPVIAFSVFPKSSFAKSKHHKSNLFCLYIIGIYVIALSMFTQSLNMGAWLLLLSVPNYAEIITEFSDLVTPAFISISLYLPLATIYPLFKWLYFDIYGSSDKIKSIWDYGGIDLSTSKEGTGPYTCELYLCNDGETNKTITIPEVARYQSLFVCGGSGSGKTSLVYEPLIARDIAKKQFFMNVSKELGFTALKTNIAILDKPYDNEYLNTHFSLNMISPAEGKEKIFNTYMKKMIISDNNTEYTYRNLGLTLLAPDIEVISHMIDVCDNYNVSYNLIDPSNPATSIGMNPFVYQDPTKIAITISSVLKAMYISSHNNSEDVYKEDVSIQAIENVSILLKEMYPKMNNGLLPNMEDLLKMLTNFELVEKMCQIMSRDEELMEKYSIQIAYFKKNFYSNGLGKETTEKYIYTAVSQLDNLLRIPSIKTILCNRNNNINFDDTLKNSEITFVCTRRGDLGATAHKAFGLFYLIAIQDAVLRRPGNESSRTPYFMYVDEFSDFLSRATEPMFTMYRKYKVGTTISVQSLSQLNPAREKENYRTVVLANCTNKIYTGSGDRDELKWWAEEFGDRREWKYSNSMDMEKMQYDSKYSNVKWQWTTIIDHGRLQVLSQKEIAYKVRSIGGKPMVGIASVNFLESKYKEKQKNHIYDFGKYTDKVTTLTEDNNDLPKKFNYKNPDFIDENNEYNPVHTDTTDSKYFFDNSDAVIFNLKKNKNTNNDNDNN